MVAFVRRVPRKKRVTVAEGEAVALGQAIKNVIDHMEPPDDIANALLNVMERLVKSFDLDLCPSCGCVAVCGDDCQGEGDNE
jgi:hypothetical protein